MTKKQKKVLVRIIIAAVLVVGLAFLPEDSDVSYYKYIRIALYFIPYFVIGYDILKRID